MILALQSIAVDVSTIPGVPNCDMCPAIAPSDHESIQCLLMVKHQLVPIDHSVINSVVANPGPKLSFSLCVVAQDDNVEWFY
jgi:hypothetical protein